MKKGLGVGGWGIRNSELFGIRSSKLVFSFFTSKLQILSLLSLLTITQLSLPAFGIPASRLRYGRVNSTSLLIAKLIGEPAPTNPVSGCSTQDIKTLTEQLLRDLPAYANRASQRARRLSRSTDLYTYVLVAGKPEFEPLTTDPGVYSPKSPSAEGEDIQQVFFTTLERQYLSAGAVELQGFHWAFFTKTESGWRLATMFTRIGAPSKKPPTPPEETSDGIIAQGIKTWLRDCQVRRMRDEG